MEWNRSFLYQATIHMVTMVTSVTLSPVLPGYPGPLFPGRRGRLGSQPIRDLPADHHPGKQIEHKRGLRKAARRPGVVMSATRRRFGGPAVKSRSSRSDARPCLAGAGTVVRGLFFRGPSPVADHLRAPDEMPAAGRPPTCRVKGRFVTAHVPGFARF